MTPVHVEASLQLQEEEQQVKTAELAYGLYEQRGHEDGHDLDWLEAESRLESAKGYPPRKGF